MLERDGSVPVTLIVFDLLELDGETTIRLPHRNRRELLETLNFAGSWQLCPRFNDGGALWHAIREHQLEGVVAKRVNEPYRPGERSWVKRKNPEWPRYQTEREAAIRERRRRGKVI
jgi:bifunctional non-homologous end joining protein LigD